MGARRGARLGAGCTWKEGLAKKSNTVILGDRESFLAQSSIVRDSAVKERKKIRDTRRKFGKKRGIPCAGCAVPSAAPPTTFSVRDKNMAKAPSDEAALHFLSDLELLDTATPDARLCLQFGHKYAVGRRPEVPPAGATAVYVRTSVASRMHLLVSQHPTDLWLQGTPVWGVTDLGSMNGTWINGYRLPAHTWRELRHDDVINIGEKSALRWRVEQPLQPPAASHAAAAGAAAAAEAAPAPAASAPGAALIHGEAGAAAAQAPSSNDARSTTLGDWVEPQPAASHAIAPYGAQRTEAPQSFGDDPREVAMHAAAAAKVAAVQAADAAAALAAASDGSAHAAAVVAAANAAAGAAAAAAESARHDAESAAASAYTASAYTADAYTADAYAVQTDDDGDEDAVLLLDAPPPAGFPPASFGDAPGGTPAMPTTGSAGRSAVTSRTSDELLADLAKSLVCAGAAGDGMHLLVGWSARYELRKEGNSAGQPQLLFFDPSGKRFADGPPSYIHELPRWPP